MVLRVDLPGLCRPLMVFAAAVLLASGVLWAQHGGGPAVVGVTAARTAEVRGVVEMAGSVEAQVSAVVASLVPGPVVEVGAREGQRVKRGDLLVRLRREDFEQDLEAAKGSMAEAKARAQLADHSLKRAQELYRSGVVARQQLDDAESEASAWRGRADAATAEIARLEVVLGKARILAPFAGVVVREHCELGEWVEAGGPVAEVVDLSRLEAVVSVPERYFAQIRVGSKARVRFDALPELTAEGEVIAIIPRADPQVRAFPVKVGLANPDGRIGVGMTAVVAFAAGESRPATVVPKDAIVTQGEQRLVYRVEASEDGEVVQPVTVRVGGGVGQWVEVEGIAAGDRVVTRGNERLFPGMAVAPKPEEYKAP